MDSWDGEMKRESSPEQKKRFPTDGTGRPVLPWWIRGPEPGNYEGLLRFTPGGGVVDPLPPMR